MGGITDYYLLLIYAMLLIEFQMLAVAMWKFVQLCKYCKVLNCVSNFGDIFRHRG